jgi:hypothetical protein
VPPATQKIPDAVLEDVKRLLRKFPSILRMGDVMPTPTHGVEHHIHTGSHPPVFAKSRCLDPEKTWNPPALFAVQITMRLSTSSSYNSTKKQVPRKVGLWPETRRGGDHCHTTEQTTRDGISRQCFSPSSL